MIQNNTTVHKSFTVLLPHALFHSKGSEQPSDMIQKKYTCAQIIHSITPKSSSCMHNNVLFPFQSQFVFKVSWPVLIWCVLLTIYFFILYLNSISFAPYYAGIINCSKIPRDFEHTFFFYHMVDKVSICDKVSMKARVFCHKTTWV